jgi:hypothetical protein
MQDSQPIPGGDFAPASVALALAAAFDERKQSARLVLMRAVRTVGPEVAFDVAARALFLEATGGLMLPDGSRRRTPGGIFFLLLKAQLDDAQYQQVFARPRPKPDPLAETVKRQRAATINLADIPNTTGETHTVKIKLSGRPGRLAQKAGYIITMMTHARAPALPAGLPGVPPGPTVYTVYITQKQWEKVARAVRAPEDVLIVEGFPAYDPELEGIAVYATNVTTKVLQQAQKAKQGAALQHIPGGSP